jgi:hypothetical protein
VLYLNFIFKSIINLHFSNLLSFTANSLYVKFYYTIHVIPYTNYNVIVSDFVTCASSRDFYFQLLQQKKCAIKQIPVNEVNKSVCTKLVEIVEIINLPRSV